MGGITVSLAWSVSSFRPVRVPAFTLGFGPGAGRHESCRYRGVRLRHVASLLAVPLSVVVLYAAPVLNEPLAGRQVFPANNWWNQDISGARSTRGSAQIIDWISGRNTNPTAVRRLHPDFGPPPYGIPYVVVAGDQPRVPVTFVDYGDESDAGAPGLPGYPIPDEARTQPNYIEGGVAGGGTSGDRHLLIDRSRSLAAVRTYATRWNAGAARWEAGLGRGVRPGDQRSPARGLDVGRRRRPRDLPGPGALRRGVRHRARSATRSA